MRPADEVAQAATDRLHEVSPVRREEAWEELLQVLRRADSPVGEAIHWFESRGYGARFGAYGDDGMAGKRRRVCELWRFVPDLLASEVVYVEEEEETKRTGTMGSCIWMQTLPNALQTNVLTFLNVEHGHFRSKDLEALACRILKSPMEADYWVFQAATALLLTISEYAEEKNSFLSGDEQRFGREDIKMSDYHTLPDWLDKCREHSSSIFSWLSSEQSGHVQEVVQGPDGGNVFETLQPELGDTSVEILDDKQPTHKLFDHETGGSPGRLTEKRTAKDISEIEITDVDRVVSDPSEGGGAFNDEVNMVNQEDDRIVRTVLGDDLFLQALLLGQGLRSRSETGLPKEIHLVRSSPNFASVLSVARAWEVDDEITLSLVGNLLVEQDGYSWSTQILQSIILPKLRALEKPASRILITALTQAGKIHPRAIMDSVMFPLICSENGASSIQCELMNRIVKDCLPEDLILSLLQKMFASSGESYHHLSSSLPWRWTEGTVGLVQNLLSYKVNLDQQSVASLVQALDVAVLEFSTSLKFGNLLLNLVSKHASRLKSHKALLHQVVEKYRTFLTKSIQNKLAAI